MSVSNKDYNADAKSIDMRVCVTGFNGDGTSFVSARFGNNMKGGEFGMLITPDEARDIAEAFMRAADYAVPRELSAADLGITECLSKTCLSPTRCADPNVRCALV